MQIFRKARFLIFLIFLSGSLTTSFSQLRFELLSVTSNRLKIVLLGDTGARYAVESSLNLTDWSVLYSGVATDGKLIFEADLPNPVAQFFRGRPDNAQLPINITPKADPNVTASIQVTVEGADTTLYAANGTTFTLHFPTNSVANPMLVTMTLLTNITGLPFVGPPVGAIHLTSDDPDFLGAASLKISFNNSIDRRKIVSFTAEEDGTDLTLLPDRVSSSYVMIPITQPGIFGSTVATPQEINALVQSSKKSSHAPKAAAVAQAPLDSSKVCFPTEVARAAAIRNEIRAARRVNDENIASFIGIERQRQLLGTPEDPSELFSDAARRSCEFYREHIEPHWPETKINCALTSVLLEASLGLERQLQLLGVADSERCTANVLSDDLLCPAFKRCLEEVKQCCVNGSRTRKRFVDVVTMVRQQQLLGISDSTSLGCFDLNDDVVQETLDLCTEKTWVGSIQIEESGETVERREFTNGFDEDTRRYRLSYHGFVTDATDNAFPGNGVMASATLEGPFSSSYLDNRYAETYTQCGTLVNLYRSEVTANSDSIYAANISLQKTNYVVNFAFYGHNNEFNVPATDRTEQVHTSAGGVGCAGMERTTTSESEEAQTSGPSLFQFSAPLDPGNTNIVRGSTNMPGSVAALIRR